MIGEHTSSLRFRTPQMALLSALYLHSYSRDGRVESVLEPRENYLLIHFTNPIDQVERLLAEVKEVKPMFFTINDDWV